MSRSGDLRGLSTIVATLLIILLVIVAIVIVWVVLKNILVEQSEFVDTQKAFFAENIDITYIRMNQNLVSISLKKTGGKEKIEGPRSVNQTYEMLDADIISVVDLSGSMRSCNGISQSCCVNNLQGSYNSYNCSGVNVVDENICISTCGGIWVDKLSAAKDANRELINILPQSQDSRIGFVGYNTSVVNSAALDLTVDVNQLNNKIDSWKSGGSTCICCGINEALVKLQTQSVNERMKIIILMSDGEANVKCSAQNTGNAMQDAIKASCDAKTNMENLTIYAIGLGGSVNQQTLIEIANCGGGKYFFVNDITELINAYRNVVVEIKANSKSQTEFSYLIIVFHNATTSYSEKVTEIPNVLVTKNYDFDLTGKLEGEINKIEVYPIVVSKSGKEVIGPLLDSWEAK